MLAAKQEQEMANEGLINLVAWCKRERESLQMQREMLQSGKFRIFKTEGSGQVDTTSASIERITANIAELNAILADYEAKGSRKLPVANLLGRALTAYRHWKIKMSADTDRVK